MLRRLILASLLLVATLLSVRPCAAQNLRVYGFCEVGGQNVVTQGLVQTSPPAVQASYPACQVTVYYTGTSNLATIFSNKAGASLSNPFSASSTTGYWYFYMPIGSDIDVVVSNGGTPFTFGDIFIGGGGGGGGGSPGSPSGSLQFNNSGIFGGVADLTFAAPHTLTLGASGLLNVAGTLGPTGNGVVEATTFPGALPSLPECTDANGNFSSLGSCYSVMSSFVVNGNFEMSYPSGIPPYGWTDLTPDTGTQSYDTTNPAPNTTFSYKQHCNANAADCISYNYYLANVVYGNQFTVSGYVRSDGVAPAAICLEFFEFSAGAGISGGTNCATPSTSTSWVYQTVTGTAPTSVDSAVVELTDNGTGAPTAGSMWFQSIQVVGNLATATALAATPTNCGAGVAAIGIAANGNAVGCFTPSGGGSSVFPITVSGVVNSGGIPCFNSTTNEETSATFSAGVLIAGGGSGACVAASSVTDNGSTVATVEQYKGSSFNATSLPTAFQINSVNVLIEPDSDTSSLAVGGGALAAQTTGSNGQNVALGTNAAAGTMAGLSETAIGYEALYTDTNCTSCVAVGTQALYSLTFAGTDADTAVGYRALYTDVSGLNNDAFGYESQYLDQTGTENACFGYACLYTDVSGSFNACLGFSCLNANTGANSAALGFEALLLATSGGNNTAVGYRTGYVLSGTSCTTCSDVVLIGYKAEVNGATDTNEIVVGASLVGGGSNTVNLGGILTATGIGTPATSTTTFPGNVTIDGTCTGCSSAAYYQTVEVGASAATQQPIINFIAGTNMTIACVNNAGATRSDCTFTAASTAAVAFSAITAATDSHAGTFAISSSTWDFTAAVALLAPDSASYAPTTSASFGYDSTANKWVFGQNGATVSFALSNAATTVNGQTCTLGSTCTVPFDTNSSGNTSQAGINLETSATNAIGITITPTNTATNVEKFEATGLVTSSGGGTGVDAPTAHADPEAEGTSPFNLVGPGITGQVKTASNGNDPSYLSPGISGRTVSSGTDTILCDSATTIRDRAATVVYTDASGTAVTMPDAGSTGCGANFVVALIAGSGAGLVTVTRATASTFLIVDGLNVTASATSFTLSAGQYATVTSPDNINWIVRSSNVLASVIDSTTTTLTLSAGYTYNQYATAATGVTYTLPATVKGASYCVGNSIVSGTGAPDTGVLTVYPPASSYVILYGVINTIGGGGTHGVVSAGAAGDAACFVANDATHWTVYPSHGNWSEN